MKDSFMGNAWSWNYADDNRTGSTILRPSTIQATTGSVTYEVTRRYAKDSSDSGLNRIDNRHMDRIHGVTLGIDNMTFGDSQSRYYVGFETVATGLTRFDGFSGKLAKLNDMGNVALTVGIQPFANKGPNGLALTSRLLVVLPETETALSLQVKALRLSRDGQPAAWRPYVGGRLDMGLTSFLTMYLQLGKDWAIQRDGALKTGISLGGGIQVGAPTCRIPGFQDVFCPRGLAAK